jgi:hypothetical protein
MDRLGAETALHARFYDEAVAVAIDLPAFIVRQLAMWQGCLAPT